MRKFWGNGNNQVYREIRGLDYSNKKKKWISRHSYHVTARGICRDNIFRDKGDFLYYLTLISQALEYYKQYKYEVICYCLIDNHVHLLVKTEDKPLAQFIGRINSIYDKYYNKNYNYNYTGHLFQGRFFSEIIESKIQLIETSKYIHLKPVRQNG